MLSLRFKSVRQPSKEKNLSNAQAAGDQAPVPPPLKKTSCVKTKLDSPSSSTQNFSQKDDAMRSPVKKKKRRLRLSQPGQRPPAVKGVDPTHQTAERDPPQHQTAQARTKGKAVNRESGNVTDVRSQKPTAAKLLQQRDHANEQREVMNSGVNRKGRKRKRKSLIKATPGDAVRNLRTTVSALINGEQRRESCSSSEGEQKDESKRTQFLHNFAARGVSARRSQSLVERLHGGRFRALNEFLYTREGKEALVKFQNDPKLFELYHAGYRSQIRSWPLNPLDCVVRWLGKQPDHWVVGDFGCGEAKLALQFPARKIHSFDLVAANERITACDISNVPLNNASLDVAVFCLSLMGKDWPSFLREAHRVLKPKGHLVIAEVSSRAASLPDLITAIEGLGFKNIKQKDLASFFFLLMFSKEERPPFQQTSELTRKLLRPCLYKRR
ncbi:hypothetical protein Esti_005880 [Eimeria stiedai]